MQKNYLWEIINYLKSLFNISSLAWLLLWIAINTDPSVFDKNPQNLLDWVHFFRTTFPFVVIALFFATVLFGKNRKKTKFPLNIIMLLIYGILGTTSMMLSPEPWYSLYWAISYLSVFAGLKLYFKNKEQYTERVKKLNYLTWFIGTVFFLVIFLVAKDAFFESKINESSGYGITSQLPEFAEMPFSRSSGISRFAAVLGLIAFVYFVSFSSIIRWIFLSLSIACGALIYFMQSRGAFFAYLGAIIFTMIFYGKTTRRIILILFVLVMILFLLNYSFSFIYEIFDYLQRGQDIEEFNSLSGRDRAWSKAVNVFLDSYVFLGYGFQADRFLIGEHVHNTYLYSLLTGGLLGLLFFIIGILLTIYYYLRIFFGGFMKSSNEYTFFMQAGTIFVFFLIRGIPEVSGSMFGVDLMVMLPIMAYIGLLFRKMKTNKKSFIK